MFGAQAVADEVIADFFAEICELSGEELAVVKAARARHVQAWLSFDLVGKRVGKLVISRDLLDTSIKKLKFGKVSLDG